VTDEQFKTWAKSFLERTDTYISWRGAAVEAIQMLEVERAKSAKLFEALSACAPSWLPPAIRDMRREAVAAYKGDG
jgi:ferritin-like protein